MSGMNFVPQIPREDGGAYAPSSSGEREARFDGFAGGGIGQQFARRRARPSVGAIVRMAAPSAPHPKRVEGRKQKAKPVMLAKPNQVVPELHHRGLEGAAWLLQVSMLALAIFQHHAQARHTMPR